MKSRRDFIKTTAVAGAGLSLLPSFSVLSNVKDSKLRVGLIGVGYRGQGHLSLALQRNDVEVIAICDIQQRMMDMALARVAKSGKPKPQIILDGPSGYKKMLDNKDIDAVIAVMKDRIDHWFIAGLGGARGADVEDLAVRLNQQGLDGRYSRHISIAAAYAAARAKATDNDRILGFGSFYTVAKLLQSLGRAK